MLRSLYTAATGMQAQQLRMDTIANNLANANTTGFKKVRPEFEDLLSETISPAGAPTIQGMARPSPLQVGLGVRTTSTSHSYSQGDMVNTSNPLDLALQGPGFFRVQRLNGEFGYTRAGNFTVDSQGRLQTQRGELVEPAITIPQGATNVTVQADGTTTANINGQTTTTELGKIEIAMFANPNGLENIGGNLLVPTSASGDAILLKPGDQGSGTISQGFLESSNVTAVEEMINMITTQRSYELSSKVIQSADQMLQKLTNLR